MQYKILITSAGTASAINVIKSLKKQKELDLFLIAVDADFLAPGLRLADKYFVVPKIGKPNYIDTLVNICRENNVDILIPIYSKEIEIMAERSGYLNSFNIKTLLPDVETIKICNNKKSFEKFCSKKNIKTPRIYNDKEVLNLSDDKFPLFAKMISGSSSIGAQKIENREELKYYLAKFSGIIIQDFINGQEITVDVFCNKQFKPLAISPRLRLATKSGQTIKGKTIDNKPYSELIEKICAEIKMIGACNMQFFINCNYDNENEATLIEINPRFSAGGLMLTTEAGANIPLMVIKEILGMEINKNGINIEPNVYMSRYFEEIFIREDK